MNADSSSTRPAAGRKARHGSSGSAMPSRARRPCGSASAT
jgi:hypothetical protein